MNGQVNGRLSLIALAVLGSVSLGAPGNAAEREAPLPPPGFQVSAVHSDPARPAREGRRRFDGVVIDALTHVEPPRRNGRGRDRGDVGDDIAEAGVPMAVLMPTPNEGLNPKKEDGTLQKIALVRKERDHVRVFCGGDYLSNWLADAQERGYRDSELSTRLNRLNRELMSGDCSGLGEFGLMHFNKSGDQNIIHLRPTFPAVLAVIDVAAKNGSWIQLHAEPAEPEGQSHATEAFGALALWYQRHPDLKVILSHTGMTNAANARAILAKYPNLMMTIKLPPRETWAHLEPITNENGDLYEDWAKLFDEMPERFMIGSDTKFDSEKHGSGDNYPRTIRRYRNLLGSLNAEAAEKIASGNAKRVLKL